MDPRHPYEQLSLFTAGLILAVWLIGSHALMLARPAMVQGFLKKLLKGICFRGSAMEKGAWVMGRWGG